jgi:hypothetical protein
LEQLNDVMDGMVGFVEGRFELAVGPWGGSGLMVKEAVGERAAELLMKENEQKCDLCSLLGEAIGVAFSVASEQSMCF